MDTFIEDLKLSVARAERLGDSDVSRITDSAASSCEVAELAAADLFPCSDAAAFAATVINVDPKVHVVQRGDASFPSIFRERCPEIPMLFVYGSLAAYTDFVEQPSIAIVGARRASAYGREVAYQLGLDLAERGQRTISGLALGIDGAGARGSLKGEKPPVAFLAGFPSAAYPRSHKLLHEQVAEDGCVISVTPPNFQPTRVHFAYRSALLGLLASTTVFVEGTAGSGAMFTVDAARNAGRSVFAVPGPVSSRLSDGPNDLLARGEASVARGWEDVCGSAAGLGLSANKQVLAALDELDREVYALISNGVADTNELLRRLPGCQAREVATSLGSLELRGIVCRDIDGTYRPA